MVLVVSEIAVCGDDHTEDAPRLLSLDPLKYVSLAKGSPE